jgi:hypothetical protein
MHMLKRLLALVACMTLVFGCSWDNPVWPKNKKSDTPLFRFVTNKKRGTGYTNAAGKIVIQPIFDSYGNYGEDDFFDGIAKVTMNGEEWYIDTTGKKMFRAYDGGHFSEGLAVFSIRHKAGFINREGRVTIPPTFESADNFSEGLAAVEINGRFGYIDKKGTLAVAPKYSLALPFSDSAARVVGRGGCLYTGYGPCDSFNPLVLPQGPHSARPSFRKSRCNYSFIDTNGRQLFDKNYPDAKDFSEELAPVGDGWLWGYIDKNEAAEPFSEGLAAVRIRDRWGYIDKNDKLVIPAIFTEASAFSEGLAVVSDNPFRRWFIDKAGDQAIAQFFSAASSFAVGRAHVRNGEEYETATWSYIDHSGRAVFTYSDKSK